MADVPGKFFKATKVRTGVSPSSPGVIEGETLPPVNPPGGSLNSVGLSMPSAFNVANSPLTSNGTLAVTGAGTVGQYIRGDGSLADFPQASGGGSSVSYYLNGSVNQGTIGGVAYRELSKVPILGAGTDFTINADGYIASFITDAGDPNLLEIPGGNWNFETYFSASSSGGTPTFYVELYKYDGTTFTLIASSSTSPEFIAFGTNLTPYYSTLAVPTTTLALTDRLAIRYYVTHSGRTITLHTENNHLCQIVTTFTTGITALNGLTAQVQNFAVGNSGTDFNIASATATHTFNLPTASATNRGALSSADWSLFRQAYNDKINSASVTGTTTKTLTLVQQDGGEIQASWSDLNTDAVTSVFGRTGAVVAVSGDYNTSQVTESGNLYFTQARVSANTDVAANTAARHNAVTLGTANGLSLSTQVLSLGLASGSTTGALSSTDWNTFNNKENAITAGTTAQYFRGDKTFQTLNTGVVPESGNLYFTNARAIASTLTGYVSGAGTISSADSILSAIQKLNGNIGALVTGVSSINGLTGAVTLTTSNIGEGTNLYFTNARARAALSFAAGSGAYNTTTGVITIPTDNNQIANGANYITAAALGAYLPLAGGTMTGNINWGQTDRGLTWSFNTDAAYIKFYNTGDGDTDSRLEFATQDNNNEYFRWGHVPSGGSFYESMRLVPNGNGSAQLIVTGSIIKNGGTSSQFLKADGSVDSNTYLTGNQTITLSGDATGSGATSIIVTLANSGVTAGTYNNVATQVRPFTVDAKGRITSIGTAVTITPAFSDITGKPTTIAGYGITDAYTQTQVNTLLAGYLPLTGGTLTGPLNGTSIALTAGITPTKTAKNTYAIQIRGGFFGAPRLQLYDLSVDPNAYMGFGTDMSGAPFEISNYFPRTGGNGRWSVGSWAGDFGTGQYVSGYNEKLFITENAAQFNVAFTLSNLAGSGTRMVVVDSNGLLSTQAIGSGSITGSGTLNYLPKFSGSTSIGNSQIFDNGTKVFIGTTTNNSISTGGLTLSNSTSTSLVLFNGGVIGFLYGSSVAGGMAVAADKDIRFETGDGSGSNYPERMRLFQLTGNLSLGYGGGPIDNGFKLDVNGAGRFLTNFNGFVTRFTGGATSGVLGGFYANSTLGFASIGVQSGHQFRIFTSDEDRLTVTSAGDVGIATNTPSSRLSLGTGIGPKFMVFDNGSSVYAGIGQDLAAGNSTDIFAHGAGGGFLTFGNLGTNKTTYTEWMRINPSGNVLIGTITGSYKLTIVGAGQTYGVSPSGGGIDIYSSANIAPHYQTDYTWYTGAFGSGTFRMQLTSAGRLLLGNSSDNGARLQVSGTSTFSGELNLQYNNAIQTIQGNTGFSLIRLYGGNGSSSNVVEFQIRNRVDGGDFSTIGNFSNHDLQIRTNNTARLTIAASTGAASFTSSVTANGITSNEKALARTADSSWGQFAVANPNDAEVGIVWGAGGTGYPGISSTYTRQWIAGLSPFGTGTDRWSLTNRTLGANTAITVRDNGFVGIGTINPSDRLSLGLGIGPKLLVYDNPAGVFSGLGQDVSEGNSTDLFAHGSGGTGFLTFGQLATNKVTYTEWARITISGNLLVGTKTDTGNNRRLQVAGNVFVDDNVSTGNGVQLKNADRPIITRGWDAFTGGNKIGVGRWGLYMESAELFIGSPGTDYSNGLVTIGGWLVNGTRQPNLTVNNQTRNVTAFGSITATSFFESSDSSLKTLVEDNYQVKGIDSVVAKLYIKNGKQELGYFAQDLQEVLPSAVSKGSDGLLNLSYREVHTAKIAYLEEKIKQLENELGKFSK